jgi:hypothetical protein
MIKKDLIPCFFKSQPLTKLNPYMTIFRKRMCTLRVATRLQLFVTKHLGNSGFWYSQLSRNTLSFRSCSYGIFIGWRQCSTWTNSIHSFLRKPISCLIKTLLRSSKHTRVWMASTRITYSIYHCNIYTFDYYEFRRLRAFVSKHRLRIRCSFEQNWTVPCTVCPRPHVNTRFVVVTSNTLVKILSPFDGDMYPEKSRSLDMCFIHQIFYFIFHLILNNGSHCVLVLREYLFTLYNLSLS